VKVDPKFSGQRNVAMLGGQCNVPSLVANGMVQAWWLMEGEGEGFFTWWPMKEEGERSHVWWPMEGKGKGSFSPLPIFPPSNFTSTFVLKK
jgi:hypothetical protein